MLELLYAAVAGAIANRAAAKYVRSLPDGSKRKAIGVIIFGGGPTNPKPPV